METKKFEKFSDEEINYMLQKKPYHEYSMDEIVNPTPGKVSSVRKATRKEILTFIGLSAGMILMILVLALLLNPHLAVIHARGK